MADHPNAQLMQRSYEALRAGDIDVLKETAASGFTFEVSGTSAVSGTFHSVEEAAGGFQRSMALTEGTMEMTPTHLIADDHVGIVVMDVSAARPDGRSIQQRMLHEWHFSDGKVTRIHEWIWDQADDVKFWA